MDRYQIHSQPHFGFFCENVCLFEKTKISMLCNSGTARGLRKHFFEGVQTLLVCKLFSFIIASFVTQKREGRNY